MQIIGVVTGNEGRLYTEFGRSNATIKCRIPFLICNTFYIVESGNTDLFFDKQD